ncbi:MAG: hydroxymethylglutaryl-CoA lyase [Legionellales bacterium]|jgi:isopropylmalate/homocitrate/citramalate synthase
MSLPKKVKIVEVGPRDGLQNESQVLATQDKITLIEKLSETGLTNIEATSFVAKKWIPQLGDAEEVMTGLKRTDGVNYSALVPNIQGFERALSVNVQEVAVFTAASEAFTQKNINCTIAESFERFAPILALAKQKNIKVRGYVSCALGCPYQGEVAPEAVAKVVKRLYEMGCYEISLGDTIGVGTVNKVNVMLDAVMKEIPTDALAIHFHDTYGQALINIYAAMQKGIYIMDSAVAGLGGCPYAKGASGNVATEDVLYALNGLGIETGVDLDKIVAVAHWISEKLGKAPRSKVALAWEA